MRLNRRSRRPHRSRELRQSREPRRSKHLPIAQLQLRLQLVHQTSPPPSLHRALQAVVRRLLILTMMDLSPRVEGRPRCPWHPQNLLVTSFGWELARMGISASLLIKVLPVISSRLRRALVSPLKLSQIALGLMACDPFSYQSSRNYARTPCMHCIPKRKM